MNEPDEAARPARTPREVSRIRRDAATATGRRGEEAAVAFARERGWHLVLCNMPVAGAEADVVCERLQDGVRAGLLLEVKASASPYGVQAERLGAAQTRRLWRMAEVLCAQHGFERIEVALVLVAMTPTQERVTWIPLEPF